MESSLLGVEPFFSIIIPTRNRVELFSEALASVIAQDFASKEIIVVVDGANDADLAAYRGMVEPHSNVRLVSLCGTTNGHGPGRTRNIGVANSKGRYIAFLDDDDIWTDLQHLTHAERNLVAERDAPELYFSSQIARRPDGSTVEPNPWIAEICDLLSKNTPEGHGRLVDATQLLNCRGFAHLNCAIFRADFYRALGGLDESLVYEEDRDIFLRSLDRATKIMVRPANIGVHRVPAKSVNDNLSTSIAMVSKRLIQLYIYDKNYASAEQDLIREYCREGKMFQLQHLYAHFVDSADFLRAKHYAAQVRACGGNVLWSLRSWVSALRARLS